MLIRQKRVRDSTNLSWDGDICSNLSIKKIPFIRQLSTINVLLTAYSETSGLSNDILFYIIMALIHAYQANKSEGFDTSLVGWRHLLQLIYIEKVTFIRQLPIITDLLAASSDIPGLSKDVSFDTVMALIHAYQANKSKGFDTSLVGWRHSLQLIY